MFFDKLGWIGLPFVMALIFVVIVTNMLYLTLDLSPKLSKLEVTKKEATISLPLRKRTMVSTVISVITLVSFILFLSMTVGK